MSPIDDLMNPVDDSSIDRLVGGELADQERRELLLRLENDPEGWRRCALAFLEDQAWRSAISGMSVPVSSADPAPSSPPRVRVNRSRLQRLSIAATVLVATFAAGLALGGASRSGAGSESVPAVALVPEEKSKPVPPPASEPIREVGWINLVDQNSGESPPRKVPILSGPGLDDQWLSNQPSPVPDYLRTQWERQGYQVEERRRLVSVVLEDGRHVSIPVDEVALQYVGQETF
ncbi:hypothetical protein P12x_003597 [Tundrisphaera lichenicola]|uniref:hypothetical protein n=1 Tax=Tundrisphaera lichenicola TaxID=2029860 RepID=UPI003EBB2928